MSERLSANAFAATLLPLNQRIQYVQSEKWIPYPLAGEVFAALDNLLSYPKCNRMPNMLLIGDSNSGKTSLIKEFLRNYPSFENEETQSIEIPVFFMQAPPVPDEGRFYDEILYQLFQPVSKVEKPSNKEKTVLRLLESIGTKMLIIDEIHNIISGSVARKQAFLNAIKNLGNNLRIPIVGVGTKAALGAMRSDDQMSNRFPHVELVKWTFNEDYLSLLESFEYILPFKQASGLSDEEIARDLLYMSEGSLGELAMVIETAAVYALRKGRENIDRDILKKIRWTLPSRRHISRV